MNDSAPHPARGIDHLVLCVHDLEAAATRYAALGFTLTPLAEHPWGTANRLVQLDGSFLELLTVARPERIVEHGERRFSFGAWNRDWLAAREGFSMLVFEGRAVLPDGSTRTVAFSLAFALSEIAPDAPMFTCHQHAPELFWKPDYQRHDNGARVLVEAAMLAPEPGALRPLFAALQGEASLQEAEPGRLLVATARGTVAVLGRDAFARWYGDEPPADAPAGPHFAAFRVGVDDLGAVEARLAERGVPRHWSPAGLTVPGAWLHGVTLAFAQR